MKRVGRDKHIKDEFSRLEHTRRVEYLSNPSGSDRRYFLGTSLVVAASTVLMLADIVTVEYYTQVYIPIISNFPILDLIIFHPTYIQLTAGLSVLGLLASLLSTALRPKPVPRQVRMFRLIVSVVALSLTVLAFALQLTQI